MNATLNIYKNCSDDKPTKTYTCKRLLFGVSKKALSISEKMQGKNESEQLDLMFDLLQLIFPDFTEEDMDGLDANEFQAFISEISQATNKEFERSRKN